MSKKFNQEMSYKFMIISVFIFIVPILKHLEQFLNKNNILYLNYFLELSISIISFLLPFILLVLLMNAIDNKVTNVEYGVIFLALVLNYFSAFDNLIVDLFGKIDAAKYYYITNLLESFWLIIVVALIALGVKSNFKIDKGYQDFRNVTIRKLLLIIWSIIIVFIINQLIIGIIYITDTVNPSMIFPSEVKIFFITFFDKILIIFQNMKDGTNVIIDSMASGLMNTCDDISPLTSCYEKAFDYYVLTYITNIIIIPISSIFIYRKFTKNNQRVMLPLLLIANFLSIFLGIDELFFLMLLFMAPQLLVSMSFMNAVVMVILNKFVIDTTNIQINELTISSFINNLDMFTNQQNPYILIILIVIYLIIMWLLIERKMFFNYGCKKDILVKNNEQVLLTVSEYYNLLREDTEIIINEIKIENISQINYQSEVIIIDLKKELNNYKANKLNLLSCEKSDKQIIITHLQDPRITYYELVYAYKIMVLNHYNYIAKTSSTVLVEKIN